MKNSLLILLFVVWAPLFGEKWSPIKDSKLVVANGEASVQVSGPGRGMTARVGVRKLMLADITFEAKGNVPLHCCIFSSSGTTDSAPMLLTDQWKSYQVSYYFLNTPVTLQFRGGRKGRFNIRNFKITQAELPKFSDVAVPGIELDLTRGRHGKIMEIDGRISRKGGSYSRLLLVTPVHTVRPLYLYLELKRIGNGKQQIRLFRNRQEITSVECPAANQWQWIKLGPFPAQAIYPDGEIVLGGNKMVDVAISRAVLSSDDAWNPSKGTEKQTSAPELAIGRGTTGISAGPFVRIRENRFAEEQSSVKLNYDEKYLRAEFFCHEKVLDPAANRLHEFKTREKVLTKNDYVVLLLLRKGRMYDFFVTGAGKLENATAAGPSFWQNRKTTWNSGATIRTTPGSGFWKTVIEIPWESIGGVPQNGEIIRFQAGRKANPTRELSVLFPTGSGFHASADFGRLSFAEKVPDVVVRLPKFLPGRNKIETAGAAVRGKIMFPGAPAVFFSDGIFDLNRTGKFKFFWQIQDPSNGASIFNSPLYELSTTAVQIHFDNTNTVVLNGKEVKSGALLADGLNELEVKLPFKGALQVNGSQIQPPGKKFTLALNSSLLWPNWQAEELAVTRGGIQMLLFSPNGFPGVTPDDYRLKLNLPPGFILECASGYYQNYKLAWTPDGEIRFLSKVPFSKVLPSHKFIAAFIRVPADFENTYSRLSFYTESKKNNILEVTQNVNIRILPALKSGKPKKLLLEMSSGWLRMLTERKYLDTVVAHLTTAGINTLSTVPNKRISFGYMFNFKSWSWSLAPYVKLHPEAALTLKNGKKDSSLVCPEHIRRPEFYAWLREQIPAWMKKAENPPIIEWDYEYGYDSGPFSCYCPACSRKTDVVSRNRNMAEFAKLIRNAIKEYDSKTLFCIYSAYQSEKNKRVYGMDWRMVKDIVDFAICGYGRPVEELRETKKILCGTPLALGAVVTPYDSTSRAYPQPLTAAWLLRRAVDSTGGILIYELSSLDGYSLSACAEVSRIMEKYEDFIRFGRRLNHPLSGWPEEDIQVIEHNDRKVLFLMNSSGKARAYRGKPVLPGKVLVEELPRR